MHLSLKAKIMGTVSIVVAMLIILGGISFWAVYTLTETADDATSRLSDTRIAQDTAFWAIKQYQSQADLIINQDMELINDFKASAGKFEAAAKKLSEAVDTPEEKTWINNVIKADERFDKIYTTGIVPEVKYTMKGVLKELDGDSDAILGKFENYGNKIAVSLWEEFNEAAESGNIQEIIKRARDLDAINKFLFWSLKQYQNQADLIINQDLKSVDDFKNSVTQMDKYKDLVAAAVDTPEEKEWLREIATADKAWDDIFYNQIVPAVKKELQNDIQRLDGESDAELGIVEKNIDLLVNSLIAEADEAVANYHQTASIVETAIIIIVLIASIAGLILGFFLSNSIAKPINSIADGMKEGANQVASASGQVSTASQSLAEGASEQAASIEETSSSMEEMSSMTQKNAENAGHADTLMQETNGVVSTANTSMEQLMTSMGEISKASDETSKIIKTIDEIAFQTNLLALNAAVEAARAGEAGAGFAVVADEVRNLAMRAAEAAKNTAELIEGTVKKVNDGSDIVSKTNEAFKKVAESSEKIGNIVAEIAVASKEQTNGIDQVNLAITEMDKVVQQNAANAEESASASEEMNAQAEQLREYVGELISLISGEKNLSTDKQIHDTGAIRKTRPAVKKKKWVHHSDEKDPKREIPFDDEFDDF